MTDQAPILPSSAACPKHEQGRYTLPDGATRILYAQRVDGHVRLTDEPEHPSAGARAYVIERHLDLIQHEDGTSAQAHMAALVADYLTQARRGIPAEPDMPVHRMLAEVQPRSAVSATNPAPYYLYLESIDGHTNADLTDAVLASRAAAAADRQRAQAVKERLARQRDAIAERASRIHNPPAEVHIQQTETHPVEIYSPGAGASDEEPYGLLVWSGNVPDPDPDAVYEYLNRSDEDSARRLERIGYRGPSLSAGDIIHYRGTDRWVMVCANAFSELTEDAVKALASRPASVLRFVLLAV